MAARSEYFRIYHLPVLYISAEQNHSQSEETNVMQRRGPCPCRKLKEDGKKFPWSAVMFVMLSGRAKGNSRRPFTVPVRWVACKGRGLCFNPSSQVAWLISRGTLLPCKQALRRGRDIGKTRDG